MLCKRTRIIAMGIFVLMTLYMLGWWQSQVAEAVKVPPKVKGNRPADFSCKNIGKIASET